MTIRYILTNVDGDQLEMSAGGLEEFLRLNEMDTGLSITRALRDLPDGATYHGGGGAAPEWSVQRRDTLPVSLAEDPRYNGGIESFKKDFLAACGGLPFSRNIIVQTDYHGLGPNDFAIITFINIPYGRNLNGVEALNNRGTYTVNGFAKDGGPPPKDAVKVEALVNGFGKEHKLRAKTGRPHIIAKYLADYLRGIERTVNPKLDH